MPDRTRKWKVRIRGKGQGDDLGIVEAPTHHDAYLAAIKAFKVPLERQNRLYVSVDEDKSGRETENPSLGQNSPLLPISVRRMKLGKPYQLYRTSASCVLSEKLAEADSKEQLWQIHNRRPDYQYAILHYGETLKAEWLL